MSMDFVENHFRRDVQGDDRLNFPVPETIASSALPIQEQNKKGQDDISCILRLYDNSKRPYRDGSYDLRCMPKASAGEITEAISTTNDANPKDFINPGPPHFSWEVKLNERLNIEVNMLEDILNECEVKYITSKKTLTRRQILSQPMSRLPSHCASFEFTIHSKCETTSEKQFRVKVTTDVETQTRDYNIMFTRRPQELE